MDMKIQPTVASFANSELRLEAHKIAGDVPETLAFLHLPGLFQLGKHCREKADHRLLASEHCSAVVQREPTFQQSREHLGLSRRVSDVRLFIAKADLRFEVPERAFEIEFHARCFVSLLQRRSAHRRFRA